MRGMDSTKEKSCFCIVLTHSVFPDRHHLAGGAQTKRHQQAVSAGKPRCNGGQLDSNHRAQEAEVQHTLNA